ncbi:MAG: hypothetical protein HYS52_01425 [Candidatus Wildermuthbacteria bacterium]|nr:hypothetical protein [Candidatus Wildermuthbacteria bacterium]
MAILFKVTTLLGQRKKQQILLIAFLGILLVTSAILWKGFLGSPAPEVLPQRVVPSERKVEVDFEFFNDPLFEEIGQPPPPPKVPEELGRENPFVLPSP